MKYICYICIFLFVLSCQDKEIRTPEETAVQLMMATEGAGRFEDYIHSLSVYAFRQLAGGKFVYAKTLAELDAAEIAGLENASSKENAKYFPVSIKAGTYKIYVVANAAGRISSEWQEDVTMPEDVLIKGTDNGQDSVYFWGQETIVASGAYASPVKIELNRVVSKLMLILYNVPAEIGKISLSVGNIATGIYLDGQLTPETKTIVQDLTVRNEGTYERDTIVSGMMMLPSGAGGSDLQLVFHALNGQEKTKIISAQSFLPDKYIRITGIINNMPGGLLDFEVKLNMMVVDYWYDRNYPDFSLTPQQI